MSEYYCGSMYAGKSARLVEALNQSEASLKILVSSSFLKRGYITRDPSVAVNEGTLLYDNIQDIQSILDKYYKIISASFGETHRSRVKTAIAIDEVHLIDNMLLSMVLNNLRQYDNVELYLAGLRYSADGSEYGNHPMIMDMPTLTSVYFLSTGCVHCANTQAYQHVRLFHHDDAVQDDYAVLCTTCYENLNKASAVASWLED